MQRLRRAFRTLYPLRPAAGGEFARRLETVRAEFGTDPRMAEILAFIDAPGRRGLVRPAAAGLAVEGAGA